MLAFVVLASACEDGRRPGGPVSPPGRDAAPGADAREDAGLLPGQDARPADDAADPRNDALPQLDGQVNDDAQAAVDAQQGAADAQPFLDAQPAPDAQQGSPDAQPFNDAAVSANDAGPPGNASLAIAQVRALPDGPAGIVIDGTLVTHVRPTPLGNDTAGFTIQADQPGPALFVSVDPLALSPPPAPGDRVRFTVDTIATHPTNAMRQATAISSYMRLSGNNALGGLVQDVTNAGDLVSNVAGYEAELVRASATISAGFRPAGSGFHSARVDTAAVGGSTELELRLPTLLNDQLGLGIGCAFTVTNPLWRFTTRAQIQAFATTELTNLTCPAARLVTAVAPRNDRVILSFDRTIGSPVASNQVTLSGGLTAIGARVTGTNVIVDTSNQQGGASYTVSLGAGVRDARGSPVDPNFRTASFIGTGQGALARINEVNANIMFGCDLVELRVVRGGSLDGWTLRSRDILMITLSGLNVNAGDSIVVHGSGGNVTCNPGGLSGGETTSPSQNPSFTYATNYDGAYDWYSTQGGIVNTDTVLTLSDANGYTVDAVLLTDAPTGPTANASEDAATSVANVGEWTTTSGTIPSGGFVDDSFCANAVDGLASTSVAAFGDSIQRSGTGDTNTMSDWFVGPATWGGPNSGQ